MHWELSNASFITVETTGCRFSNRVFLLKDVRLWIQIPKLNKKTDLKYESGENRSPIDGILGITGKEHFKQIPDLLKDNYFLPKVTSSSTYFLDVDVDIDLDLA